MRNFISVLGCMWAEDDGMGSLSMVKNVIASAKIHAPRFVLFNGIFLIRVGHVGMSAPTSEDHGFPLRVAQR